MNRPSRIGSVLPVLMMVLLAPMAEAQQPSAKAPTAPAPVRRRPAYMRQPSSVHQNPYPYPGYYQNDRSFGYRNPGGVGRYEEYYPPGDQFQSDQGRDPVQVATFNGGSGVESLNQQIAAQQLGVQKYNSIQSSIDRYARPAYGYGFGVGHFSGGW